MADGFDWTIAIQDLARIGVAAVLGGILGLERELNGHFAGLRTHMMVSIGCAVFMIAGLAIAGASGDAASRVVQGIATGIGFLGAGTILKIDEKEKIKGLTTASSIWLAAALGTVAGMGQYELAVVAALLAVVVLGVIRPIEKVAAHYLGQNANMDTPAPRKKK